MAFPFDIHSFFFQITLVKLDKPVVTRLVAGCDGGRYRDYTKYHLSSLRVPPLESTVA